ncbi:DUF4129 domain-containing protein [Chloroflexota bacterium]
MAFIIRRLANISWVASFLSPLAVILFEVLWVYPWLAWAGEWNWLHWSRPLMSLPSLILLVSTSFFVTRFFSNRRNSLQWLQLSIIIATIFIVLRVEYNAGFSLLDGRWFAYTLQVFIHSFSHPHPIILSVLIAVYLSWRGIKLGHSSLYFNDIYRPFLVGLAALIAVIIFWGVTRGVSSLESLTSAIGLHVVGFFFFGLMALALGNLQAIRRRMLLEEMEPLSNRRWVIILFGIVGGIVLLGISIASIFSSDFVAFVGQMVTFTFNLLTQATHYLLIPIGYLAELIVNLIQFLVNHFSAGEQQPLQMPAFFEPAVLPDAVETHPIALNFILVLKWLLFTIVTVGAFFLLYKAVSRLRSSRAEEDIDVEEISESLWSWQGFSTDLRLLFSMLFRRWKRKKIRSPRVNPALSRYITDEVYDLLDMRELYRHLLWETSTFRIKRQRQETPYEYARRLSNVVPDSSEQLREITDLYIDSRYGDTRVEQAKMERANSLWRILRKLIRGSERTDQLK